MIRGYAREGLSHIQIWLSPSTIEGLELRSSTCWIKARNVCSVSSRPRTVLKRSVRRRGAEKTQ